MKFKIQDHSNITKTKAKQQVELLVDLRVLEDIFLGYLKKNIHLSGVKEVFLNLTLCGKSKIKTLNKNYRKKDKVTDVLSFGLYENLRPDQGPFLKQLPQIELGDIFICRDVAKSQAKEFHITYQMEVIHLMVHGFLHLLGYDHEISLIEEKIMELEEQKLVKKAYKKLGLEK